MNIQAQPPAGEIPIGSELVGKVAVVTLSLIHISQGIVR